MVNAYYSRGRCGKGPVFLLAAFPGAHSMYCTTSGEGGAGWSEGGGGTFLLSFPNARSFSV